MTPGRSAEDKERILKAYKKHIVENSKELQDKLDFYQMITDAYFSDLEVLENKIMKKLKIHDSEELGNYFKQCEIDEVIDEYSKPAYNIKSKYEKKHNVEIWHEAEEFYISDKFKCLDITFTSKQYGDFHFKFDNEYIIEDVIEFTLNNLLEVSD